MEATQPVLSICPRGCTDHLRLKEWGQDRAAGTWVWGVISKECSMYGEKLACLYWGSISNTLYNCLSCWGMWRNGYFSLLIRGLKLNEPIVSGAGVLSCASSTSSYRKARTLEQMLLRFSQRVNKWPLEKEKILAWEVFRENALFFRKLYIKKNEINGI